LEKEIILFAEYMTNGERKGVKYLKISIVEGKKNGEGKKRKIFGERKFFF